ALRQHYINGQPVKQIARDNNITTSAVYNRLDTGFRHLKLLEEGGTPATRAGERKESFEQKSRLVQTHKDLLVELLDTQAEVLKRRYIKGQSVKKIAADLHIRPNSVRHREKTGLERLRVVAKSGIAAEITYVKKHAQRIKELRKGDREILTRRYLKRQSRFKCAKAFKIEPANVVRRETTALKHLRALVDSGSISDLKFVKDNKDLLQELERDYRIALRHYFIYERTLEQVGQAIGRPSASSGKNYVAMGLVELRAIVHKRKGRKGSSPHRQESEEHLPDVNTAGAVGGLVKLVGLLPFLSFSAVLFIVVLLEAGSVVWLGANYLDDVGLKGTAAIWAGTSFLAHLVFGIVVLRHDSGVDPVVFPWRLRGPPGKEIRYLVSVILAWLKSLTSLPALLLFSLQSNLFEAYYGGITHLEMASPLMMGWVPIFLFFLFILAVAFLPHWGINHLKRSKGQGAKGSRELEPDADATTANQTLIDEDKVPFDAFMDLIDPEYRDVVADALV
ncbi:hypothetical protein BVX98_01765, partial [bacterium F11]